MPKCKHSFRTVPCHSIRDPSGTGKCVNTCLVIIVCHKTNLTSIAKLRNGQLVIVPPIMVRRLKSHFVALPCGVDLILGLNGYIWVSKPVKENEQEGEEGFDAEAVYSNQNDVSLTAGLGDRSCHRIIAGHRSLDTQCYCKSFEHHSHSGLTLHTPNRYYSLGSI